MEITSSKMQPNWTWTLKPTPLPSSPTLRLLYRDSSLLTKLPSKTSKHKSLPSCNKCKLIPLNCSLTSLKASNPPSPRPQLLLLTLLLELLNGRLPSKLLVKTSNRHGTTFQMRLNTNGTKTKLLLITITLTQLLLLTIINNKVLLSSMNWPPRFQTKSTDSFYN